MNPTQYPDVSNIYANPSGNPQSASPGVADIYATEPTQTASQPTQQPSQPHESGNWFTHLLPTIGGIGGSILGGLATAGLGGEVVGGAGGSALGKTIENALEGKKVLQGNDVTAGLEGGVGAGVGGIAGKALGKAGEYLGSRAGTITKAADDAKNLKKAQQAEVDFANATKNNYNISPKLQSGDHLALGSNQKTLQGLGYDATDPYQMAKAAEAGYHSTDLSLNGIYDEALQGAKPVDMSGFGNQVFDTMKNTGTTNLEESPLGKALQDFHTKTNGAYGSNSGIELPKEMNAADVRKLQQAIGREQGHQQTLINNAENNGISNVQAESAYQTLGNLYKQLGEKIKTPEVDSAIAARTLSPEERTALITKFGDTHGNQIADTIDKAQSADHLLQPMQQYTQMAKAGKMGIDNLENMTGTPAAVARAKMDINGDGIADVPPPSTTQAVADSASHGGNPVTMLTKFVSHAKDNPRILDTLSRVSKVAAKAAPVAGAAAGASNAQIQDTNATMGGTMPVAMNPDPTGTQPNMLASATTPTNGLSRDDLITLALYSPSAFQALVTPSAGQQQTVAAANTAEQALSGLGNAPGGGIMSQLAGKFGIGPTGEYQRKAAAAAQQIAAALPGTDAATIEHQLTNYNAGSGNIEDAIRQLMQNLEASKQNNTNSSYQQLMNYQPSVLSQVPVAG